MTENEIVKEQNTVSKEVESTNVEKSTQENIEVKPIQTENKPEEEDPQTRNWRQFRQQREIERKQKAEAERIAAEKAKEAQAFKEALDAIVSTQSNPQQTYSDQNEDEIQKRIDAALESREKKWREEQIKKEQQEYAQRLEKDYPDFNKVCSTENLDYLQFHYPEIAAAYKYAPDNYETWANIYRAVKKFVPNSDMQKDAKRIEQNLQKPQSLSAPILTKDKANPYPAQLDEARLRANWERMRKEMNEI